MAETEEVKIESGTETAGPFAPSLLTQAKGLLAESPSTNSALPPLQIEYKPEDLEGLFEMPFDVASFVTKIPELELEKDELEKLCRIWLKPIQALQTRYPSVPWIIAASMTMGIITEKVLIYYITVAERRKERLQREGRADSSEGAKKEETPALR